MDSYDLDIMVILRVKLVSGGVVGSFGGSDDGGSADAGSADNGTVGGGVGVWVKRLCCSAFVKTNNLRKADINERLTLKSDF